MGWAVISWRWLISWYSAPVREGKVVIKIRKTVCLFYEDIIF